MAALASWLRAAALFFLAASSLQARQIVAEKGGVTFMVPDTFTPLTSSEIARFNPGGIHVDAVGDKARALQIFYQLTGRPMTQDNIASVRDEVGNNYAAQTPGLKWIKKDIAEINGIKWFVLEYVAPTHPIAGHFIVLGTSWHDFLFTLGMSGAASTFDQYKDLYHAIISTIKVNAKVPLDEPPTKDPQELKTALSLAFDELNAGELDAAEKHFQAVLKESPHYANAEIGLAAVYQQQDDPDQAVACATDAIADGADATGIFSLRDFAEVDLGEFGAAHKDADLLISKFPKLPAGYYVRAVTEFAEGDFARAGPDFDRALAAEPHNVFAMRDQAWLKFAEGDSAGAATELQATLDMKKIFPAACYKLACIHLSGGGVETAQRDLDRTIATSSQREIGKVEGAQLLLWKIKSEQGQKATADSGLSAFIADPSWKKQDWFLTVAGYLLGQKNESEALATSKKNPYRIRDHENTAYYFIGAKHALAGDKAGATSAFQKCIACNIPDSEWTLLAKLQH